MSEMDTIIVLSILNMMLTVTVYSIVLVFVFFERKRNNKKPAEGTPLIVGMRVSHFKYGAGTVTAVKENNKIFCVNFDKFGVKEFSTLLCAVLGAFKVLCPTGSNNEEQK